MHILTIGERMNRYIRKHYRWIILAGICLFFIAGIKVHAEYQKRTAPLSGVVVVLDPGHGGKDDGARAEGVKEQEINLQIAQKVKAHLETAGATVQMSRDGAYDLASDGAENRKREDMKKRVAMINEEPTDVFISIHLNSYPNTAIQGAQAFYKKEDEASKTFAQLIQDGFNALTQNEKSIKTGDYYILNNTNRPGVLVECGFISNAEERAKLASDEYQEQIAIVLYESVCNYLDVLVL